MDFSNLLTPDMIDTLLTLITIALIFLIKSASGYLKTKTKNEKVFAGIEIVDRAVIDAVKSAEQTLKKELKQSNGNISLTMEERRKLRDSVVASVMTSLSSSVTKELMKVTDDLRSDIVQKVESAVLDVKIEGDLIAAEMMGKIKQTTPKSNIALPDNMTSETKQAVSDLLKTF